MTRQIEELNEQEVRLIFEYAGSVLHLEMLLLISESTARGWTIDEIASRTYIAREHALGIVQDLARKGLLADGGGGRFVITSEPAGKEIVTKLTTLYRQNISRIATLLHSSLGPAKRQKAEES